MWPTAEPDIFVRDESVRLDEQRLTRLWQDPVRRVIGVHRGHIDLQPALAEPRVFLGEADGSPWFAVLTSSEAAMDLRAAVDGLTDVERAAALTAVALDNWHSSHPRCPRCGEPTQMSRGGWVRRCPADGSEHFPRTDPAIIALVIDDQDRALLGRRAIWPQGWYSTLAGFVEPGETFEQAVVLSLIHI